jgi:hypothetical protein
VHLSAAVANILVACTDPGAAEMSGETGVDEGPQWLPLVSAHLWSEAGADDDPFGYPEATSAECTAEGHGPEEIGGELGYEIDTGVCNALTVVQTALVEAPADSELRIRVWHETLEAPEPATGVVAVAVAGQVVLEHEVGIPAEAGLIDQTATLPIDTELDTLVAFHVHNHGRNTWALLEVSVALR